MHVVFAEHRVEHRVRAGERAGVRGDRRDALLRDADLHGDDRLAVRRRARERGAQPRAVAAAFEIDHDHARVGIVGEPFDAGGDIDAGLVAGRDEMAEAEPALDRLREEVGAERAALADDADRAGARPQRIEIGREGRVEAGMDVEHAEAVRARAASCRRRAQRRASSSCSARPSSPVSAKPDENITAAFTPLAMHSSAACSAALAGTAMIA